jgi:hypothetical protein
MPGLLNDRPDSFRLLSPCSFPETLKYRRSYIIPSHAVEYRLSLSHHRHRCCRPRCRLRRYGFRLMIRSLYGLYVIVIEPSTSHHERSISKWECRQASRCNFCAGTYGNTLLVFGTAASSPWQRLGCEVPCRSTAGGLRQRRQARWSRETRMIICTRNRL